MRRNIGWWLAGVTGLLLGIAPVLFVFLQWFHPDPEVFYHFLNHRLALTSQNTLFLMSLVAALSAVWGLLSAFLLHYYPPFFPSAFRLLLMLPLSLPAYVSAFVYLGLSQSAVFFPVVQVGHTLFGPLAPGVGSALVLALCFYPYVFVMAYQSLRRGSHELLEATVSLGRNFRTFVWKVLLPRSAPWVFGGVLLVLMEVLSDFGAVSILGIDTWTTEVYKAWHGFFSFAGAAQIATLPLLIILILLSIEGWLHRRRRLQGGVQGYERTVQARSTSLRSRTLSTLALGLLVFFSVLLPTAQLLIWLPQSAEHGVLNPSFVYGFFQSLTLGVGAGLLVVFLALLLILSSRFTGSRILASMDKMASLCYALPGPVLALGLLGVFYFLNWPTMGGWVLIMGLALRFLVVGGQPLRGDFLKIPAALDEVSESVGRSRVPLLRKVYAPLIRGGLVTGFLVAALESFKEMPLTLMLRPFGWEPLSVQIYSLTTEGEYERAALPALLLVLLSVISVTVVWFQQGGEKNAQG